MNIPVFDGHNDVLLRLYKSKSDRRGGRLPGRRGGRPYRPEKGQGRIPRGRPVCDVLAIAGQFRVAVATDDGRTLCDTAAGAAADRGGAKIRLRRTGGPDADHQAIAGRGGAVHDDRRGQGRDREGDAGGGAASRRRRSDRRRSAFSGSAVRRGPALAGTGLEPQQHFRAWRAVRVSRHARYRRRPDGSGRKARRAPATR